MGVSWQLEILLLYHRWMASLPMFIPDKDQIICKTYMTRVEGENTRLRHYLARLHRKTLCYSKSVEMLKHSIRLVIHYLKFWDVPVPYPSYDFNRVHLSFANTSSGKLTIEISTAKRKDRRNTLNIPLGS
jgi:hypothetical protein